MLNLLPEPQVARFIRLLPQTWFQGGAPCLRAEILACPVSGGQLGKGCMGRAWFEGHSSLGTDLLSGTHLPPDPNDLFPEAHTLGSSNSLDFRHHNYKAMRKVRYDFSDPGRRSAYLLPTRANCL